MRRLYIVVLVCLSLGAVRSAHAEDAAPLTEEQVLELVAKGASVSADDLNAILEFDPAKGFPESKDGTPLTLAVIVRSLGSLPKGKDFAFSPSITPKRLAEALAPRKKDARPSLILTDIAALDELEQSEAQARGIVRFRVSDAWEGRVRFVAMHGAKGWSLRRLWFEDPALEVASNDGTRWFVVTPRSKINPLRGSKLQLPTLSCVGEEPKADRRLVISVTAQGDIFVEGRKQPQSLDQVHAVLRKRARDPMLLQPDGSSALVPLLDIDASMPWVIGQWLLMLCAAPDVKATTVAFGVMHRGTLRTGALTIELPQDRSVTPVKVPPPLQDKAKVKLFGRGMATADPRLLYELLARLPKARTRQTLLEVVTPPPYGGKVPYAYILRVLDAACAAEVGHVVFEGAALRLGANGDPKIGRTTLKSMGGASTGVRMKINAGLIESFGLEPRPLPLRPRAKTVVGFTMPADMVPHFATGAVDVLKEALGKQAAKKTPFEGPATNDVGPPRTGKVAFPLRGGDSKDPLAPKAPEAVREAANEALRWLATHQSPNGGWEAATFMDWCDGKKLGPNARRTDGAGKGIYDVGLTGLILQAFLAAGHTHRGKGPYAKAVGKGLRYLKERQAEDGCFGSRRVTQWVYNHALATIAMTEAYAMTLSPIFKGSAQRGIKLIENIRNPYFAWRYGDKPGDNDTSVTAWMTTALRIAIFVDEAAKANGQTKPFDVDVVAFEGVKAWLEKVTDIDYGRVGYIQRGTGPARPMAMVDKFPGEHSESMTSAAMFMRSMIHPFVYRDDSWRSINGLSARLLRKLPPKQSRLGDTVDFYYWYWGTLAMWQRGGSDWITWEKRLHRVLLSSQRKDGTYCEAKGSWNPQDPWSLDGGRLYATAMNVLNLLVYERYPRTR